MHRIGRTGRAGKKGVAITLATPLEYKDLSKIKQITKAKLTLCEITQEYSDDAFSQEISHAKVNDKSVAIYEKLKDKIDTTQLCLKLIALHLEKSKQSKIGFSKEQIAQLESEEKEQKSNKKSGRFSRNAKSSSQSQRGNSRDRGGNKRGGRRRYDDVDKSQPYTGSIWG